jgi:carbon monoxide dehydrogenase subunit G
MRLESKIGKIPAKNSDVYNFLTDFDNFKNLIPADKISDWKTEGDTCTFSVSPVGKTGFKLVEKEPNKLIKLSNLEDTSYNFFLWVQLKEIEPEITAAKLTMEVQLNAMMEMMAKKPLQEFLDKLVEQLTKIKYA